MVHKCSKEDFLKNLDSNVAEIKKDVKKLYSFEMKVTGAVAVIAFLITVFIGIYR